MRRCNGRERWTCQPVVQEEEALLHDNRRLAGAEPGLLAPEEKRKVSFGYSVRYGAYERVYLE